MESMHQSAVFLSITNSYFLLQNSDMSAKSQEKSADDTLSETFPKFIQKRNNLKENFLYYSQSSIDSNTRHCVERLKEATTIESIKFRLEEFNLHLNKFPLSAILANKMGTQQLVKNIRNIRQKDASIQGLCLETLARLG